MKNIYEKIEQDDLTPDLEMISNICGIDTVRTLLREFGGLNFYIPKLTRLENFIQKYMNQNKDKTLKQIATDLKVSEQFLKNKIRERKFSFKN